MSTQGLLIRPWRKLVDPRTFGQKCSNLCQCPTNSSRSTWSVQGGISRQRTLKSIEPHRSLAELNCSVSYVFLSFLVDIYWGDRSWLAKTARLQRPLDMKLAPYWLGHDGLSCETGHLDRKGMIQFHADIYLKFSVRHPPSVFPLHDDLTIAQHPFSPTLFPG